MKQVINGKMYNTETAEEVCHVSNNLGSRDFSGFSFTLYKTKKGSYFAAGEGGPMTMFARPAGNMTSGGSGIIPLDVSDALRYAESSNSDADSETIAKYFTVEEA